MYWLGTRHAEAFVRHIKCLLLLSLFLCTYARKNKDTTTTTSPRGGEAHRVPFPPHQIKRSIVTDIHCYLLYSNHFSLANHCSKVIAWRKKCLLVSELVYQNLGRGLSLAMFIHLLMTSSLHLPVNPVSCLDHH